MVQPPLFVWEDDGDLQVVPDVEALRRAIEPWDLSDRVEVFDIAGTAVLLRAAGVRRTRFSVGGGEIVVDGVASQPDTTRFRALLSNFVMAVGPSRFGFDSVDLDELPLQELAERVASFHRPR